jgi:hypothetical protein
MATRGAASSRRAIAAERREAAWQLRKRGHSFRSIAERLAPEYGGNYSKSQAQRDVQAVLDELNERTVLDAAGARALDLARLDDLLVAFFPPAIGAPADASGEESYGGEAAATDNTPDRHAADVVLKTLEQRAKLLGLHRQEVALSSSGPLIVATGDLGDLSQLSEEELDAIIRNLEAALGAA